MKNIMHNFLGGTYLLLMTSCSANETIDRVEVKIENFTKNSSQIRVTFINHSHSMFLLSKYVFCDSGVIVQDLFQIGKKDGDKDDKAYYGGAMDIIGDGEIGKNLFLQISPMEKISCEIDISRYYLSYSSKTFEIFYKAKNPSIENQKEIELISNKTEIYLPETNPMFSPKAK